ncbi:partial nitric oxide reductase subunit C, partial [Gammaproteobacteria bacterium]
FYDEKRHRRLMPKQDLSEAEITDLIAFLDWVSKVDNQGWPPRPILVTGATIPGTDLSTQQQTAPPEQGGTMPPGARPVTQEKDPMALGQALFRSVAPACTACHSVAPGVNMAGPSLGGLATVAQQRISAPDYKGAAKDVAGYIRESIVEPSAHVVPGAMYSANGQSFMPATYGKDLKPEQIDQLVAYLASLK